MQYNSSVLWASVNELSCIIWGPKQSSWLEFVLHSAFAVEDWTKYDCSVAWAHLNICSLRQRLPRLLTPSLLFLWTDSCNDHSSLFLLTLLRQRQVGFHYKGGLWQPSGYWGCHQWRRTWHPPSQWRDKLGLSLSWRDGPRSMWRGV